MAKKNKNKKINYLPLLFYLLIKEHVMGSTARRRGRQPLPLQSRQRRPQRDRPRLPVLLLNWNHGGARPLPVCAHRAWVAFFKMEPKKCAKAYGFRHIGF